MDSWDSQKPKRNNSNRVSTDFSFIIKRKYKLINVLATEISRTSLHSRIAVNEVGNMPRETINILVCGDEGAGKTTFLKDF
jgi:Flp pilus assembly CpaF family ATPase